VAEKEKLAEKERLAEIEAKRAADERKRQSIKVSFCNNVLIFCKLTKIFP